LTSDEQSVGLRAVSEAIDRGDVEQVVAALTDPEPKQLETETRVSSNREF
jgi:hypothetical protein